MSINSKAKGNTHERKVANMLSEWAGVKFMRTPMSGAIHNFNDKRVVSDIVPPLSIGRFPFSIECKKVEYDWDFSTIMSGTSTFWKHWKQAEDDAKREDLNPMLVFTKNRRPIYVAINTSDYNKLNINELSSVLSIEKGSAKITIMLFEELLEKVSLENILKIFSH